MFAICRVNSLTGAVKYQIEAFGWTFNIQRAFLFDNSFDAVDFLHWCFPSSPFTFHCVPSDHETA